MYKRRSGKLYPAHNTKKPTDGFEPSTPGLQNQSLENVTPDKTKTCETPKEQLTPQLTPKSQKQAKIDTSELPSDLAEIVAVWPELPEHIKAAIKTLTESCKTKQEEIDKPVIYNMGYQFRTLEDVLNIIKEYGITVLVDVRSIPYSRKNKDFNKNNLMRSLPCRYLWRGKALGGKEGERISQWREGLVEIANLAKTEKVMLICLEDDVNRCHRRVLAELLTLHYNIHNISV